MQKQTPPNAPAPKKRGRPKKATAETKPVAKPLPKAAPQKKKRAPVPRTEKATTAKYSRAELVSIMNDAIEEFSKQDADKTKITNFSISYFLILAKLAPKLSASSWQYYQETDAEISSKFAILRAIQEQKIIEGASVGSLNPAFSMFLLKSKHGYIEADKRAALRLQKKKTEHEIDRDKEIDREFSDIHIEFTNADDSE